MGPTKLIAVEVRHATYSRSDLVYAYIPETADEERAVRQIQEALMALPRVCRPFRVEPEHDFRMIRENLWEASPSTSLKISGSLPEVISALFATIVGKTGKALAPNQAGLDRIQLPSGWRDIHGPLHRFDKTFCCRAIALERGGVEVLRGIMFRSDPLEVTISLAGSAGTVDVVVDISGGVDPILDVLERADEYARLHPYSMQCARIMIGLHREEEIHTYPNMIAAALDAAVAAQ
jgi:hypothetical protein